MFESFLHGSPLVIVPPTLLIASLLIRHAIRRKVRPALIVCGAIGAEIGMIVCGMMASHTAGVIARRIQLKEQFWVRFEPHVTLAGVPYDFRLYSLVLFGVLLVWNGALCVRAGVRIMRGDPAGWKDACRASAAGAILVVPLVPLQPVALQVLALCAVNLAIAIWSRRGLQATQRAPLAQE